MDSKLGFHAQAAVCKRGATEMGRSNVLVYLLLFTTGIIYRYLLFTIYLFAITVFIIYTSISPQPFRLGPPVAACATARITHINVRMHRPCPPLPPSPSLTR